MQCPGQDMRRYCAGQLIQSGILEQKACDITMLQPITDEPDVKRGIKELITSVF